MLETLDIIHVISPSLQLDTSTKVLRFTAWTCNLSTCKANVNVLSISAYTEVHAHSQPQIFVEQQSWARVCRWRTQNSAT